MHRQARQSARDDVRRVTQICENHGHRRLLWQQLSTALVLAGLTLVSTLVEARPTVRTQADWEELTAEELEVVWPVLARTQLEGAHVQAWWLGDEDGHGIFVWISQPGPDERRDLFAGIAKSHSEAARHRAISVHQSELTEWPPSVPERPVLGIDQNRGRSLFFSGSIEEQHMYVWTVTTTEGIGIARVVQPLSAPSSRVGEFFTAVAYDTNVSDFTFREPTSSGHNLGYQIGQLLGVGIAILL